MQQVAGFMPVSDSSSGGGGGSAATTAAASTRANQPVMRHLDEVLLETQLRKQSLYLKAVWKALPQVPLITQDLGGLCNIYRSYIQQTLDTMHVYNYSEPQQLTLFETTLELLNHFPNQPEVAKALVTVVKELCAQRDTNAMMLTAACTALASVAEMVDIVESCIVRHFNNNTDLYNGNHYGWADIVHARLRVPELLAKDFLDAAVASHAALTLFAVGLQELSRCRWVL